MYSLFYNILINIDMIKYFSVENIANLAPNYINENDVILTIGRSRTVEAFLKV